MSDTLLTNSKIKLILQYFEKVDRGDESYLDLFTDDVKFFFPKFGTSEGVESIASFASKMGTYLKSIKHDIDSFNFIIEGNTVVVEGVERGTMADGTPWPDGKISQGRFCSVFEFTDELISRMYIYVDPDYASKDKKRVKILSEPGIIQ